jgi:DNA mismatch repair protein MSH6
LAFIESDDEIMPVTQDSSPGLSKDTNSLSSRNFSETCRPLSDMNRTLFLQRFTYSNHASSSTPQASIEESSVQPSSDAGGLSSVPIFMDDEDDEQKERREEARFEWLLNPRDSDGKPHCDATSNPRTLYIPDAQWAKFTPFERQFWEIKSHYYDTVVFFKKGKFYELYEKDAEIGSRYFDLKVTDRVNMKMAGVPEATFDEWAARFVKNGFKVAKVDQLENSIGKTLREQQQQDNTVEKSGAKKAKPKKDDIIRRELTSIMTAGTLVEPTSLTATYCMSLKDSASRGEHAFCITAVLVDMSTRECHLVRPMQNPALFETLLVQFKPVEIVFEKKISEDGVSWLGLPTECLRLIKQVLGTQVELIGLKENLEFFNKEQLKVLLSGYPSVQAQLAFFEEETCWDAFGGLLGYLKTLKLDIKLLQCCHIVDYDSFYSKNTLVLNGQTLVHLEITHNLWDGGSDRGTLWSLIDKTRTAFGKRLLYKWLLAPLGQAAAIRQRQEATLLLDADKSLFQSATSLLTGLMDLERSCARMAALRCKPREFLRVMQTWRRIASFLNVQESRLSSSLLLACPIKSSNLTYLLDEISRLYEEDGHCRDTSHTDPSFNTTNIVFKPKKGTDDIYDGLLARLNALLASLDNYIAEIRRSYPQDTAIIYRDMHNTRFQLELPIHCKPLANDWQLLGKTSKVHRYWTPALRNLVKQYELAREEKILFEDAFLTRLLATITSMAHET